MTKLEEIASGCLLVLASVVVVFLSIALFLQAFNKPEVHGSFAIAGAVLVGSSLIAIAISIKKGNGS